MNKSKLIDAMIETANDLSFDLITIQEIESLNLASIEELPPFEIKRMRVKEKLSQSVMARILNVALSTYQKWERGEVKPKGTNLKLLRLVHDHGIQYIIS